MFARIRRRYSRLNLPFNADLASSQNDAVEAMKQCIQASIRSWMIKDKLRMNDSKTEFMIVMSL